MNILQNAVGVLGGFALSKAVKKAYPPVEKACLVAGSTDRLDLKYNGPIIDIHTHVQPASVIADRRPYVEAEPDFRTLYENPKYTLSGSADVLAQMKKCGVDSSVILGICLA